MKRGERSAGMSWFLSLDDNAKWQLGDEFVLGTFDWSDWFWSKPSAEFLNGAEAARLNWEACLS